MTDSHEANAHDLLPNYREPLDWYIEVCAVCGCQLGPGIGSRTRTGRCVVQEHRSTGGVVVRVVARAIGEQHHPATERALGRFGTDPHAESGQVKQPRRTP